MRLLFLKLVTLVTNITTCMKIVAPVGQKKRKQQKAVMECSKQLKLVVHTHIMAMPKLSEE